MDQPTRKKSFLKRLVRIVIKTVLSLLLFLIVVFLLILTPPVQNFLRKKAVNYLEKKLDTRVVIGSIYIGLSKKVVVEDIYIEDRQKDTLLSAGSLKVDISIPDLLFKGKININKIELKNSTAKIKRQLPDTSFNFQFIIDAFAPPESTTPSDTIAASPVVINTVKLDRIRLIYTDIITGNDVEAWLGHFDTRIGKIDPGHLQFDIPEININGLTAKVKQVKPLTTAEPLAKDKAEAREPVEFGLSLNRIGLENIKLEYSNDVSALYSNIILGKSEIRVNDLDLAHQLINLENISLANTTANIRLGKKKEATVVIKEARQEIDTRAEAGWRILASSIRMDDNHLRFDNDNASLQKTGIDYGHLKADDVTLHVNDFVLSNDSISGMISEGRFKEQTGFVLEKLETRFLYSNNQSYLRDLHLKTPGTDLKRDAAIQYASLKTLTNDIGNMRLDADIANSKVLVKDILTFVPSLQSLPAFADPSATWYINSRIKGRLADLQVDVLQIQGLSSTKIDVSGNLAGLPDMKNVKADLVIHNISTSKRDIHLFMPANTLPGNITLPGRISINGRARGNTDRMHTDLLLRTDLGNASVKGDFQQLSDPGRIKYDASVQTASLDLGIILQQKDIAGPITAFLSLKGSGTDPKTANAELNGKIQSATFKQYTYRDVDLAASLLHQRAKLSTGIIDPNIHFTLDAEADLSKEFPALVFHAMIDSIKTQPLHLTSGNIIYRGRIEADFPVTDLQNLQGRLFITQALLVHEKQRVQLDTVRLFAGKNDRGNFISLRSDIAYAELNGQYDLMALGNIFQQAIQPYFAVQPAVMTAAPLRPYDFMLNVYVINSPALKTFIPGLERLDSVSFQSHFSDRNGWSASMTAPVMDIGINQIRGLQVQAGTEGDKITVQATLKQFRSGPGIEMNNTMLTASLANNNIDFILNVKDKAQKDKYNLQGSLKQPATGNYTVSLQPQNLLLNYDPWNISAGNKIFIAGNNISASDFILSKNGQQLRVNSLSENAHAPMQADFSNFKLVTLTGLVQADSSLADGTINGRLTLIDLTSNPIFTGDLTVTDLRIQNDTVGNVHVLVNNKVSNTYHTDITITGRGNDVRLAGNYYPMSANNNFEFDLDIRQLPLATAQAFSRNAIRNATGFVNGKFSVRGTMDKPSINGDLNFNKAAFTFSMLNSYFSIDREKIEVNAEGIRFDDFVVRDSLGNQLRVNGTAATKDFRHYRFDMRLRANDFRALNSSKKDNQLFYGQMYFNTNLTLKGTEELPLVDGRLTINKKTKMTFVLPQQEPGVVEREGVVEFVDFDAPVEDSLFLAAYDSLNASRFTGMEISVTIEVDKEADLTLIVDEGNGDFLNVRGEALLTANVDRSGKVILAGTYDLESGTYELSFNLLRRKFLIEKGSKITWEGEPTKADVDITAKYIANVAPLDLVKNQLSDDITTGQRNTYLQKLPFDVMLKMEGELLRPKISFDIILPDNKSYIVSNDIITNVRTRLGQLRQEEGEMNKQVFSLLLLNRFVAENPFASSGSGTSASTIARQSVSKLLTEQLNRLATDLVKGVDLNFDIQSSEDYTTGERRDRTDLNIGLSKRLLNDRLTVTVGSNFELEGPQNSNQQSNNIAGNVALDYKISSDGRYMLRAYRKNEYQGVIDGYVVETGVGFVITLDYNRFREIFQSQEKRRRLREERRRRQNEQQTTPAASTGPAKQQG